MWFTTRTSIGHNQYDEEQTAESCTILAKSQSTMWQTCFFRNLQQILKDIESQILQGPTAKLDKTMVNSLPEFWHRSIMFIYCQLISIKLILRDLLVIYDDLCFEKCFRHLIIQANVVDPIPSYPNIHNVCGSFEVISNRGYTQLKKKDNSGDGWLCMG